LASARPRGLVRRGGNSVPAPSDAIRNPPGTLTVPLTGLSSAQVRKGILSITNSSQRGDRSDCGFVVRREFCAGPTLPCARSAKHSSSRAGSSSRARKSTIPTVNCSSLPEEHKIRLILNVVSGLEQIEIDLFKDQHRLLSQNALQVIRHVSREKIIPILSGVSERPGEHVGEHF
jgi:hypothetical protein